MDQDRPKKTNWLDGAAVVLSALCLVHCLALPLIVIGVPFLAQFAEGHLHLQMLVIVLPLSTFALAIGFRRHRISRILSAGIIGMLLLVIGATIAHAHLGLIAWQRHITSTAFVHEPPATYSKTEINSSF